jgi:hypothetical protein
VPVLGKHNRALIYEIFLLKRKVLSIVSVLGKYDRALIYENFWQARISETFFV